MAGVSVVFVGNFLYPEGLAETKRIQHFIDAVVAESRNTASVLLLRQNHPGRDDSRLVGVHRGIRYETLAHHIDQRLGALGGIATFISRGIGFLGRNRVFVERCFNLSAKSTARA